MNQQLRMNKSHGYV